jgi:hypothetical protein
MTVLKWFALVGFIIGAAGIPLVILAGDVVSKFWRKKPAPKADRAPRAEGASQP